MAENVFGGSHTEIKLEKISKYLNFYSTALKKQPFNLIYIDAFAGTGSRNHSPIPGQMDIFEAPTSFKGSTRLSLETRDSFDKYVFIELKEKRAQDLEALTAEFPDRDCEIRRGDANTHLQDICRTWDRKNNRAVVFLDPFGCQLTWETLEAINATQSMDVWYLFPTNGANRLLSRDPDKLTEGNAAIITNLLGTEEWQDVIYKKHDDRGAIPDLFGGDDHLGPEVTKKTTLSDLEQYAFERLSGLFAKVLKPYQLKRRNMLYFSLFLCISNPHPKAIGLATKAGNHILKD